MKKEKYKAYQKAWEEAHKEERKAYKKEYYEAHKEEAKAYYEANKEHKIAYQKAYNQANKEQCNVYQKAYQKSDVNLLGQPKHSIRQKSRRILKQMHLHLDGYETHHCFGYEDPAKFIYISKSLHLKIHQYLRDNKIDASSDHWMAIRDMVNSTDEFVYIKC